MTQVYAHRGLHTALRENTVDAFRAAVDLGVDGVEFDVRETADGVLVVHHDPVAGSHVIATSAAGDLPDYVPTLDQALEACRGVHVNVEIKNSREPGESYDGTGRFAHAVVERVHQAHWTHDVIFSCFDLATCRVVRSCAASVRVGFLVDASHDVLEALHQAHDAGLDAVHPQVSTITNEVMARSRELGLALYTWTVNSPVELAAQMAWGVDGVITDDPATALTLLSRVKGPHAL